MQHNKTPGYGSKRAHGKWSRFAAVLLSASLLGGCAATIPAASDTQSNLESLFKDAEAELGRGQRDRAIALLNQAAKEHPTSMVPWLKMANVWFEVGNYPSSILAANEVLQRDATNQEAKSLLIVAGLRVAAGAVAGLRPNGAAGTSARVEAENLTNSLREALGEKVLVPAPAEAEAKPAIPAPRSKSRKRVRVVTHSREAPSAGTSSAGTSDPFKSLK